MKPREFIRAAVAWLVLAPTADRAMTQGTEATAANSPHIETVRVKPLEPATASYQFRLGDGNVDLLLASRANRVSAVLGKPRRILRLQATPSMSASVERFRKPQAV